MILEKPKSIFCFRILKDASVVLLDVFCDCINVVVPAVWLCAVPPFLCSICCGSAECFHTVGLWMRESKFGDRSNFGLGAVFSFLLPFPSG